MGFHVDKLITQVCFMIHFMLQLLRLILQFQAFISSLLYKIPSQINKLCRFNWSKHQHDKRNFTRGSKSANCHPYSLQVSINLLSIYTIKPVIDLTCSSFQMAKNTWWPVLTFIFCNYMINNGALMNFRWQKENCKRESLLGFHSVAALPPLAMFLLLRYNPMIDRLKVFKKK